MVYPIWHKILIRFLCKMKQQFFWPFARFWEMKKRKIWQRFLVGRQLTEDISEQDSSRLYDANIWWLLLTSLAGGKRQYIVYALGSSKFIFLHAYKKIKQFSYSFQMLWVLGPHVLANLMIRFSCLLLKNTAVRVSKVSNLVPRYPEGFES